MRIPNLGNRPLFPSGRHGLTVTKDGWTEYYRYSQAVRPIYAVAKFFQSTLSKIGIHIHDPFFQECTPRFECCKPKPKKRK